MILALDKDNVLWVFDAEQDVQCILEPIDIENREYEFCDSEGYALDARITVPISTFRAGAFMLSRRAGSQPGLAMSFVDRARTLGNGVPGINSLEALRRHLMGEA